MIPADEDRVFASPLARRLASSAGLDLAGIAGSGPNSRIVRRDVERARDRAPAAVLTDPATTGMFLRATCRVECLLELRRQFNRASPVPVSLTDLLIKAAGTALQRVPALRSGGLVDVGFAVATEPGHQIPVVRGVDALSLSQVAAAAGGLCDRSQTRRLHPEDLGGAPVILSNLGPAGVEEFAVGPGADGVPVLAIGAARDEPVAVAGAVVVRPVIRIVLSIDRRRTDPIDAAAWLLEFVRLIEEPVGLLL